MAIEHIAGPSLAPSPMAPIRPDAATGRSFESWLQNVDQNIRLAESQVQALALGETDNLHQVMIAVSKARTGFELAVQVRNRLVEGYQEILRMGL